MMTLFKPTALVLFLFFGLNSYANLIPIATNDSNLYQNQITVKKIEQLTGRKLSFLQKIEFKILQRKLRKIQYSEISGKQERQGKISLILGTLSICLLALSIIFSLSVVLFLLAIPVAILSIIFGAKSVKGNQNKYGKAGIIMGSITLGIIVLAVALIAISILTNGIK